MAEEAIKEKKIPVKTGVPIKIVMMASVGALIIGLAVAFGVFTFMGSGNHEQPTTQTTDAADAPTMSEGEEPAGHEQSMGTMVTLAPFIVNLADYPEVRYLKITVILEVLGAQSETVLDARTPPIRDAILVLLSSKDSMGLRSTEGKLHLREEIAQRVNGLLPRPIVKDVYFTEFVVQ